MATRTLPPNPPTVSVQQTRCAIYCRKSNTEGLDGDFSSLDNQRDACASYIQSQAGLGWVLLPDRYEDGGFSGGSMDRPALKRLLTDIETGLVDCIVLYKLDRLSRSLAGFVKIVEVLDRNGATFVSVTESFNTSTSTGRLHLNMLLAFGQYERELAAERIRDKVAGAKKRGKHTGGPAIIHCADSEANAHMRLRYLLGERQPVIQGYDQDRWATELHYHDHPLEPALSVVRAVRANTVPLLERLSESDWQKTGRHTEHSQYGIEKWLEIYGEHLEIHARQIERNFEAWKREFSQSA